MTSRLSARSKRAVGKALEAILDGQAAAAQKLAELIANAEMPEAAKAALQRAYDAVAADHPAAAAAVVEFSERMPAWAHAFVEQVVAQAQEDATTMRENRPDPPLAGGKPDDTPAGPPADPGRP